MDNSAANAGSQSIKLAQATNKLEISTVVFIWSVIQSSLLATRRDDLPALAHPHYADHAVVFGWAKRDQERAAVRHRQLDQPLSRQPVAAQFVARLQQLALLLFEAGQIVALGAGHKKSRQYGGTHKRKA